MNIGLTNIIFREILFNFRGKFQRVLWNHNKHCKYALITQETLYWRAKTKYTQENYTELPKRYKKLQLFEKMMFVHC